MIGYVTIGTNDLERAQKFFDAVFGEIGAKRTWSNERMTGWGTGSRAPSVVVAKPYDESTAATAGNGTMVAISTTSPEDVHKVYAKALALGGKDEGAPGHRTDNFYGAYFRDLDGNKFVAFCIAPKK